jgi:hypothetical protein
MRAISATHALPIRLLIAELGGVGRIVGQRRQPAWRLLEHPSGHAMLTNSVTLSLERKHYLGELNARD